MKFVFKKFREIQNFINYCFISRNFAKKMILRNFVPIKSNMFFAQVIMG
jgi:hypothetical protein